MPRRSTARRFYSPLQPFVSLTPRGAAIGITTRLLHLCSCCGRTLASHFDQRNRWIGCKAGAR